VFGSIGGDALSNSWSAGFLGERLYVVDRVPEDSACSLYGRAALAAGAPAVWREGPVRRWPWQQRWPSSWRQSSSILLNHLPRPQDIFDKDFYLAKAADAYKLA